MSRTVLINGNVSYLSNAQIIHSNTLKNLIIEYLTDLEERKESLITFFSNFLKNEDAVEVENRYDIDQIIKMLFALSAEKIDEIDSSSFYSFPKLSDKKEQLTKFVESIYNLWRNKHRFMIQRSKFVSSGINKIYKEMILIKNNTDLKSLITNFYRQILINISDDRLKVLRQLPSGAQVGFSIDYPIFEEKVLNGNESLYKTPFVWGVVFEPPVIFYTKSNKRKGIFKVIDSPILDKIELENPEDWFAFPIHVGKNYLLVYVYKEYLAMAAGLTNLFELTGFGVVQKKKPDGIYFFGLEDKFFEKPEYKNGVIYKENDGTYVSLLGRADELDYFGYMKKMILTNHNLKVIDEGNLPIHGALAEIVLRNGKRANVMLMGDSGAGKSETLDALNRLSKEVSEVNILIDDMGSLEIDANGNVVAFGTETGAFVRLDDLQPGYAYSAIDRSIFMNPNETNARVIVPYSNYREIIRPTKIDYFLYANNYTKAENNDYLVFYDNCKIAYEVFSKGARMAKGTTSEVGLTYSYFANPFGAIQRKEKHEIIANKFLEQMIKTNVKVGEIKTQLGIAGFEEEGPMLAAKALLKLINEQ
ncbi:ATPase [Marinitoga sp. 38H-ov]|uniref:ATPase n=1 Tax=Marinitoga sp. 38H-ov TaxID=1755814 RepID=UPI0013EC1DAE|nr:ATPase [Marinitoga sp. 38H-ov]KAF2955515.1 ATPase [Marinitoga sp. 38H-ov]